MTYIYPVVSRRAQGVSVGINLNVNNACNWRCIYCQVPNLTRGGPPAIDLAQLKQELNSMMQALLHGDFMQRYVAETDRRLMDIAFSGNGEPTTCKQFGEVLDIVAEVMQQYDLIQQDVKVRLITNGSQMDKVEVQAWMKKLAQINGEVWFKIDAGNRAGFARINDIQMTPEAHIKRLKTCAALCPTLVQTCMFALDEIAPSEADIADYLALIKQVSSEIKGVHLYSVARPSYQPEAPRLGRLDEAWLNQMAERIRTLAIPVYVNP
ncbi:MAG: radical SAM protein [Methylophilaceae bacterium]|nr:radical SAM protein [Methylophilaceae bacterium]